MCEEVVWMCTENCKMKRKTGCLEKRGKLEKFVVAKNVKPKKKEVHGPP